MKYTLIFLCGMLWISSVFAKPNVFCNGEDSLDDYCMVASNVMYEGYIKGFTGSVKKYQKSENLNEDVLLREAQELIPYNIFHSAFLFCGESQKDKKEAQKCLIKELQKYVIVKVKEQQMAAEQQ